MTKMLPSDPSTFVSRLLGNNSNYLVINLSDEYLQRSLNISSVRHFHLTLSSLNNGLGCKNGEEPPGECRGGLHRPHRVQSLGVGMHSVLHQVLRSTFVIHSNILCNKVAEDQPSGDV